MDYILDHKENKKTNMYNVDKIARDIAINIYALRKENGMSSSALGEHLGKAACTVTKWERGESMPAFTDILRICNLFSCTLDELFAMQIKLPEKKNRECEGRNSQYYL